MTQLVQQLEARLRVKLLHRTTRKLGVTPDGAVYYERVIRLLADMDDAETSLSNAAITPRGRLRVDVPSPLARLVLVPALPTFHTRYPDIQFDMGVSDRVVDLIGDNVDCVLRGGEIKDQSLIARHVGDLPIGAYVAPSYVERLGIPAHPRELENTGHRIVGFLSSRTGRVDPLALHCGSERIEIKSSYVLAVDDGNAYLEAGLAGLGVIALPRYMAAAHQARGALIPLFEQWRFNPMPLYPRPLIRSSCNGICRMSQCHRLVTAKRLAAVLFAALSAKNPRCHRREPRRNFAADSLFRRAASFSAYSRSPGP